MYVFKYVNVLFINIKNINVFILKKYICLIFILVNQIFKKDRLNHIVYIKVTQKVI